MQHTSLSNDSNSNDSLIKMVITCRNDHCNAQTDSMSLTD